MNENNVEVWLIISTLLAALACVLVLVESKMIPAPLGGIALLYVAYKTLEGQTNER